MEKAKLIKIRKSGFQLGKVGSCLPINCCAGVPPSFFFSLWVALRSSCDEVARDVEVKIGSTSSF